MPTNKRTTIEFGDPLNQPQSSHTSEQYAQFTKAEAKKTNPPKPPKPPKPAKPLKSPKPPKHPKTTMGEIAIGVLVGNILTMAMLFIFYITFLPLFST